jgi:hypothetical protein
MVNPNKQKSDTTLYPTAGGGRFPGTIIYAGIATLLIYFLFSLLAFFVPGSDRSHFPPYIALPISAEDTSGLVVIGSLIGLCAVLLVALYLYVLRKVRLPQKNGPILETGAGDGLNRTAACIFGFAVAFHLVMLFFPTLLSTDLFDYVRHGRIFAVYGENPLTTPAIYFQQDPFFNLGGWVSTGSVYGPLHVYVSGGLAWLSGDSVGTAFILFKAFFLAANLVNLLLIWKIATRLWPGSENKALMLYGWNPFILILVAANGHNDILMLGLVLAGILLYLDRRFLLGVLCLTLATLLKFVTLPLLVLYLVLVLRQQENWRRRLAMGAGTAMMIGVVTVLGYLPLWDGWNTFGYLTRVGNKTGFTIASLFSDFVRGSLHLPRGATVFILAAPLVGYMIWKLFKIKDIRDFISTAAILAFFIPLVMFWFQPWYLVLALGLLALRPWGALYMAAITFSISVIFFDNFWWQTTLQADFLRALRVVVVFGPPLALLSYLTARDQLPNLWRRTMAWSLEDPGHAHRSAEATVRLSPARMALEVMALTVAAAIPLFITVSASPQLRSLFDLMVVKFKLMLPF